MRFSRFILKVFGWKTEGTVAPDRKCVILEAPHTSVWDFFIGYFYYRSVGGRLHIMIKKEFFVFPLGLLLKALGGFPIDREHPATTVREMIHKLTEQDGKTFHMVMCPEGTRKAVRKWKTGYHTIARAADMLVYLGYIDWGHKRVGLGPKVELTDNARADTDRIQKMYEEMDLIPLHPEGYATK
ncbi:MAG: 1-acyl-sn-glycerol-3-phosphate acyltransferase [Bacteroidales bacterium]|nr:1-acyl-sn-glycerol-3-phosphate acyltransferase [Bacteroidales bacterium]